ncbi:MAG: cytidine deaminase [Clostridiales bacterium]|nr:cytidine deaminase [Clostridiales bacterium]
MKELIKLAEKAYENSYSPYSGIRIGAAIIAGSGKIYTGTNIENASYGATICAERSAISKAISDGETEITAVAVTGDLDDYAYPCGICRQVMSEFMKPDMEIAVSGKNKDIKVFKLKELLPSAFEFNPGGK